MPHHGRSDSIADFLIAEYNALQDRAISLQQTRSTRVNFFLVVVAAVVAGSANLVGSQGFQVIQYQYLSVIALVALSLLTLGFFTLQQCVDESVAIVVMYRRAGRIRLWFVEQDAIVAPYVAFHYGDDHPRMSVPHLAWRGAEAVVLVINTVLLCVVSLSLISPTSWLMVAVEIAVATVVGWFLQTGYVRVRLRRAEKQAKGDVHFPAEEMAERISPASD
jgi:hypothetical protein